MPAKVSVHYQPKGVVGIIVPWNFPVMPSLGPLISALAAGKRTMLKLSELTPATNRILGQLLQQAFDSAYAKAITGEVQIAQAFANLPFDHLLFTGAATVGKQVMQQEIFGPILPIVDYQAFDQAIDYVNQRARPLALYLMSQQSGLQERVIQRMYAGGVCLNDTLVHVADAPFGGIGASGMGAYHGIEDFREFSHAKTVFKRTRFYPTNMIKPPG